MKPLIHLFLLATVFLAGCSGNLNSPDDSQTIDLYSQPMNLDELKANLGNQEINNLTPDEIAGLVFMREEEKLARDVYLTFLEQFESSLIFRNIAMSEQRHADAVLLLLDRYDIDDPVGDNPVGVFQSEALQELFEVLINEGSPSLTDALYVGCAIEEIDILDLHEHMAHTDYADLLLVYGHLLDGSGSHLRAFVRLWEQQSGLVYEPRFLSEEEYAAILNEDGNGSGSNGSGGNGTGGNQGNGRP